MDWGPLCDSAVSTTVAPPRALPVAPWWYVLYQPIVSTYLVNQSLLPSPDDSRYCISEFRGFSRRLHLLTFTPHCPYREPTSPSYLGMLRESQMGALMKLSRGTFIWTVERRSCSARCTLSDIISRLGMAPVYLLSSSPSLTPYTSNSLTILFPNSSQIG